MNKKNIKMFFFLLFFLLVGVSGAYPLLTLYGMNTIESQSDKPEDSAEQKVFVEPPESRTLITLSELKAIKEKQEQAAAMAEIAPASGTGVVAEKSEWTPEQEQLNVEAVLVPRHVTVVSSSQDGQIADIPLENGDEFKKDDILVRYDCADLEAEAMIAGMQKNLTEKKRAGIDRLFKLDIISDVDRLSVETEDSQANAKIALYKAKLESCIIRARFDGRVTKRLANAGEYTRTDRVLMEVASNEPLQAQFLLPSKWLRWVNKGAPLEMTINETGRTYTATVTRIYGEIDPVSQSIQMVATLNEYTDSLLPGMSGQAVLDIGEIKKAGVTGFLQSQSNP